ncbi:hypothetical protein N7492_005897 [Penicillium capsulatum]|uniref:CENP-V/GFA domain-containing protein n=1 Tax=Penicillium capsulatum TaxID=69766 RepID=A0A9W9LRF9_9EURO|nr:hypothetical protein N7492_005897 [Penicillium capsulatum]KAJ6135001.1 hypothetical protein N7512_000161 [Penicillium capsulatum]
MASRPWTSKVLVEMSKETVPPLDGNNAQPAESPDDDDSKPRINGGLEVWLTVVALFCVFVNSWGVLTTFGAFQEFYQTVLLPDQTPSAISWVGSIQATLIPMVGIFSGPLVDSGYLRPLIISGSFLTVFGLMMTSLSSEYYQVKTPIPFRVSLQLIAGKVLLAQGFCVGLGGGIAYIPALAVVSTRFTTKRPIAIGVASIGSSVGAVIFPVMFRQLQPKIGFPWAVRCIGFVSLLMGLVACTILCRRPGLKTRARSLVDWTAFREPSYMMFSVSLTCVMLAYYVPIFYVASYGRVVVHTTTSLSFYMVAIVNGSSVIGRVVPYLLVAYVKSIAILVLAVTASAIAMFTWIAVSSIPGFIVWACYWGTLSGVLVTAPTSIVAHPVFCPRPNYMGTRLGMMWGISSFGALGGTPIAGALVNLDTGKFVRAQALCHCIDCRKLTGTLFSYSFVFKSTDLDISGSPKAVAKMAESGNAIKNYFCPDCGAYHRIEDAKQQLTQFLGTPLFGRRSKQKTGGDFDDETIVRAGIFDDVGLLQARKPDVEIYTDRRLEWITPIEGADQVCGMLSL